ncbi:MAG: DUF3592 domain-containing protein [Pseudomonadota bacterium]
MRQLQSLSFRAHAVLAAFYLALISLGAAFMTVVTLDFRDAAVSTSWPTARATMLGPAAEGIIGLRGASYVYVVDGKTRRARRTRFLVNNRLMRRDPAMRLRQGDEVVVAYHPSAPARTVVRHGYGHGPFLGLIVASFVIIFIGGAGLWRLGIRQ